MLEGDIPQEQADHNLLLGDKAQKSKITTRALRYSSCNASRDGLTDSPGRMKRKLETPAQFKLLNRADQTDISVLYQDDLWYLGSLILLSDGDIESEL